VNRSTSLARLERVRGSGARTGNGGGRRLGSLQCAAAALLLLRVERRARACLLCVRGQEGGSVLIEMWLQCGAARARAEHPLTLSRPTGCRRTGATDLGLAYVTRGCGVSLTELEFPPAHPASRHLRRGHPRVAAPRLLRVDAGPDWRAAARRQGAAGAPAAGVERAVPVSGACGPARRREEREPTRVARPHWRPRGRCGASRCCASTIPCSGLATPGRRTLPQACARRSARASRCACCRSAATAGPSVACSGRWRTGRRTRTAGSRPSSSRRRPRATTT
jgi:hypothetical protein